MLAPVLPLFALLLGAAILLTGNGLQGILIPVRASLEGFGTQSIGLIASAYSVGFVAGCFLIPHVVRRVGHIRTFAVTAAVAACVVLCLVLLVHPWGWIPLRAISGFCFAGLFMVIESWMSERSSNENRGRVFAIYMIVNLGAGTAGQLLLPLGNPADFTLFIVTAIAITFALVPVGLTSTVAPTPIQQVRLRLGYLYRISPVGVMGCLFIGVANGAYTGLGPLYAQELGMTLTQVSLFMATSVIGGALAQVPLGRLSDRMDRRRVIFGVCLGAAALGAGLAAAGGVEVAGGRLAGMADLSSWLLILLAGGFGFFVHSLYALCVAHTNDHVTAEEFVEASSGLLLTYGIGAIFGPFAASFLMSRLGPGGLFIFTVVIHLLFALFTLYRMARRSPVPEAERSHYVSQPGATKITPASAGLDPRAPEVEMADI